VRPHKVSNKRCHGRMRNGRESCQSGVRTFDDEQCRRDDVGDGVGRDALVRSLVVGGQVRYRQVASVLQRLADHRKRTFALQHRRTQ